MSNDDIEDTVRTTIIYVGDSRSEGDTTRFVEKVYGQKQKKQLTSLILMSKRLKLTFSNDNVLRRNVVRYIQLKFKSATTHLL